MLRLLAVTLALAVVNAQCGWQVDNLATDGSPVLNVDASGFQNKDEISTVFYLPNKWTVENAQYDDNGAAGESLTALGAGDAGVTVDGKTGNCYDLYNLAAPWGAVVGDCNRAEDAAEITFRCKVEISIAEDLGVIRDQPVVRREIFELPLEVVFPKQVDTHLESLSVFDNPNNIAAIIYQEVDVNVSNLDVDATVRIFSSLQWPFKCDPATVVLTSNQADIAVAEGTHQDCVDANAGDIQDAQPGDANACNQVFEILLTPAAGVCELDGTYRLECQAVCQDSFAALTDCPILQDDLGANDPTVGIDYTLDSEYFCPQVVDEVQVSATLAAYKDHDHTVPATNFIVGQTVYFKAVSSSPQATIVSTTVDHVSMQLGANMPTLFDQGANPACDAADNGDTGAVQSLVVEDGSVSGNCEVNSGVQANFQFLICEADAAAGCPFGPPEDGQEDFDIWVTLDINFKDVNAPNLLEENKNVKLLSRTAAAQPGSQARRATASGSITGSAAEDDEVASSASALVSTVAFVAAAVVMA